MSITNKLITFFALLFLFISVLLADLWSIYDCSSSLAEAQKNRFESHKIAEELRRSSDELTRMARSYVITGNDEFKKYFNLIADIRDGKSPRPNGYDGIFWDYVTAGFNISRYYEPSGREVSIVTLMKELRFSDKELSLLAEAKKKSDQLMVLENRAFAALEGKQEEGAGRGTPDKELAEQILFGQRYHEEKAGIMEGIDLFFKELEIRTNSEVLWLQGRQQSYQVVAIFLAVTIVIYLLFSFIYFRGQFIKPIGRLKDMVRQAEDGVYSDVEPHRMDEIGALINAFNSMNKTIRGNIAELNKMSLTDELTKLCNRRAVLGALQAEKNRFDRYQTPCSIIIADIDHFKKVNDNFGHHVGDSVLMEMANIFMRRIRKMDICGRWGGEEFLFICPNTKYDDAKSIAESLRRDIDEHLFPIVGHVTASFGVSELIKDEDVGTAVTRADDALYDAKEKGRNKVG